MSKAQLVVVGGGISGLAAAWTAARYGYDVVVLEREREVGGKARSIARDGWLVEGGPSGYLAGRPEMERLVDDAGLRAEVVTAGAAAKKRFVRVAGATREIVPHPIRFLQSGILTPLGAARVLMEPFVPRHHGGEETVWGFAARRLGREFADRLMMPMTLGVFAGDARALSLDAAFPRMRALEQEHGSLIRGMIARRGGMGGKLSSFRGGMQRLPRVLAERGGFEVRRSSEVRGVERTGDSWSIWINGPGEPLVADAIVFAGEPWATADLLAPHDAVFGADLRAINCPPVSVVALGYAPPAASRVPQGFGVLISRGEGFRMLGNLWETRIYPERGPEECVMVRAMFGGSVDEGVGGLAEDALVALTRDEVERLYGISDAPVFEHVVRWPRAIPQYEMGHLARVGRIEQAAAAMPKVWITGNGLRGVSFADAASDGVRTGEAAVRALGGAGGRMADRTSYTMRRC